MTTGIKCQRSLHFEFMVKIIGVMTIGQISYWRNTKVKETYCFVVCFSYIN